MEFIFVSIFFLVLCLFLYLIINKTTSEIKYKKFFLRACFLGFGLRFVAILMSMIFPELQIHGDDGFYISKGLEISKGWENGELLAGVQKGHFLYNIYNAIFFYIFGFQIDLVRLANSFLGVVAGIYIFKTVKIVSNQTSAKIALLLMLFYPSLIGWQTLNMKEATIVLLYSLIIYNLVLLIKDVSLNKLLWILLLCGVLTLTRSYAGIFVFIIILILFFNISKYSLKNKIAFLFCTAVVSLFFWLKFGNYFFGSYIKLIKNSSILAIDEIRLGYYKGSSEILLDYRIDSVPKLLLFIPIGIFFFLFSPFPFYWYGTILQKFAVIENLVFYVLFVCTIIGIKLLLSKEKILSIFIVTFCSGIILLHSSFMGNMGLAFRMKDQLMPFIFIFASIGLESLIPKLKNMFFNINNQIFKNRR